MPKFAVVETTDPPLSPARLQLRHRNEQFASAITDLERDRVPEKRLMAVVAELDEAEAELQRLRTEDERILGEWLGSGDDTPRPTASDATLECEQRLRRLRVDGDAARKMLPTVQDAVQHAAERARDLGQARKDARCMAAVDAAHSFASGVFLPALNAMLASEAPLIALRDELFALGREGGPGSAAHQCAMQVDEIRLRAKEAAGAPRNPEAARRLLEALLHDPAAEFGA